MKRYILKKDLPTFKAGEEFCVNENGDLVLSDGDAYKVVYFYKELEKFPNILTDWFDKVNTGFYLNEESCIAEYVYNEDPYYLNYRKSIGNDFKTEEEAKEYKKYLVALQIIKDDAKGFVPDWRDCGQIKHYGYYDHDEGSLEFIGNQCYQSQGVVYFGTEKDIKDSFKKHRKEWLIVLGVENESN